MSERAMMTEPEEAMCRRFAGQIMAESDPGTVTRETVTYYLRGLGGAQQRIDNAIDFTWSVVDFAQQYGLEVS